MGEGGREECEKCGKWKVEHYCGYCRTKFVNETETARNDINEEMTWSKDSADDDKHDYDDEQDADDHDELRCPPLH